MTLAILLHGFGQRYDLPIPLALYLYAAAGVVVISFVMVAALTGDRTGERAVEYPTWPAGALDALDRWPWTRRLGGALGVLALFTVIVTGIFGSQRPERNPAEYIVWIYFWVGLLILSALAGNFWEYLDPFSALYGLLRRFVREAPIRLPERLRAWPAAVLLFGFEVLEQASGQANRPLVIGVLALLYTLFTLAGMVAFGREAWCSRVEFISILFDLVSRFSPVERTERGLRLRPWGAGLLRSYPPGWDRVVFVITTLSTLAFDGLSATPQWQSISISLEPYWQRFGEFGFAGLRTLAMLTITAIFLAAFTIAARLIIYFGYRRVDRTATITFFALTLVPIALVYDTAHYYSYLVVQSQWLPFLLRDPFGAGPAPQFTPNFTLANAAVVWYVQVVLIVAGHVIAVYLAHLRAAERFRSARNALISQYPMLILMVCYTMTSLWILAQPTTRGG